MKKNKKNFLDGLDSLALGAIISLIFMSEFITGFFSYSVFLLLFTFLLILFIVLKPMSFYWQSKVSFYWYVALIALCFSFLFSERTKDGIIDMILVIEGCVLIFVFSKRSDCYSNCLNLIVLLSIFFAFSVLLQLFLPSFYMRVMSHLPFQSQNLMSQIDVAFRRRGFSNNAGFTAGYICTGIIACYGLFYDAHNKFWYLSFIICTMVILLFALLFTGKRAHTLFLVLAGTSVYLIHFRGKSQGKKYWYMIWSGFALMCVFLFFKDLLTEIPFINRAVRTINGIMIGEDVSNSRFAIWKWAFQLFKENPWFGIGWGNFKETTVGNATSVVSVDTHNIYLQLFCENGIIGGVCVCLALFAFWNATRKAYIQCHEINDKMLNKWRTS